MDIFLQEQPIVEIDLFDFERVLSPTQAYTRTAVLKSLEVKYGISAVKAHESGIAWDIGHEATLMSVSMLLADNILWRLGQAVAAAVLAQSTGDRLGGEGEPWFDEKSGIVHPVPSFIDKVANFSTPINGDPGRCVFDITSIELGSLKVTARMVLVVVNTAASAAPVAAPVAAPATSSAIALTLTAISAVTASGTLGWAVYVYRDAEHKRRIDDRAAYYAAEARNSNWQPIQKSLLELGFYRGQVDNLVGPQTVQAMKDFAESVKLPRDVLFTDPRLLRALAKAILARGGN